MMIGAIKASGATELLTRRDGAAPPAFLPPADRKPNVVSAAPRHAETTELLYQCIKCYRDLGDPSHPESWTSRERKLENFTEKVEKYFVSVGAREASVYAEAFRSALKDNYSPRARPIDETSAHQSLLDNANHHAWHLLSDRALPNAQTPIIDGLVAYCRSRTGREGRSRERDVQRMLKDLGSKLTICRREAFVQGLYPALEALEKASPLANRPPR